MNDKQEIIKFNNLLFKISKKDKSAFEEFYNSYSKLIYLAAYSVSRLNAVIEESVDDVLVKIWNGAAKFPKIKNPIGWLITITTNCVKDRLKSVKNYEEIFDISVTDKGIENVESADSFHSIISCLDDEEKKIVIMRIAEELSFKEIAKFEKKPLSSVSSTYYRALEKIKLEIKL